MVDGWDGAAKAGPPGDMNLLACAHATVTLTTEGDRAWWACRACGAQFAPVVKSTCCVHTKPQVGLLEGRIIVRRRREHANLKTLPIVDRRCGP